ncbi:MAG: 4-(cytidine 5'-diphospho)-2-C-methyl-D-erythritol kinase [Acidobacteria bacterium]|nr:4-(cytidine 5'-diphospho)-2-C-methyl-D-erythritol kinase [Acidobacteriota bacterium]MCA1648839.1 4-(cytidine 5'-diphospho)-2-C-methyl-D-erythritol kinase [Acidobacteriota bacterium]
MPPAKRLTLTARAHAKVNLDLRVLGTRPDGYHELRTVFQAIDLHDSLVCADRAGPFTLKCRTPGVPLDDTNLVWRAAAALWKALGRPGEPRDTAIAINKAIPVESGLGGGSADAAAALQALARLWGGAPITLLREVASGIGADVPFFLAGGTALGLGRGEEIYPLVDLPPHWVVIVLPPFGVSTAEAYAWYDEDRAAGLREPRELQVLPVPWPTRAAQMINDLEPPVLRRHPEIGTLRTVLKDGGAVAAAMSGSGSAVFGLFRGRAAASRALRPLSKGGSRALLTRTLTRAEHERRARPVARR